MADLDLRPVTKAEMLIERLEFPSDTVVKFVKAKSDGTGLELVHTLDMDDDWSIVSIENLYINVDFLRFSVMEFTGWEDILAQSEYVAFEGILYQMYRLHRPIGINRVWGFKLEPTSDFQTATIP